MKKFLNCYFDFVTQEKKVLNNKIIADECFLAERFLFFLYGFYFNGNCCYETFCAVFMQHNKAIKSILIEAEASIVT